jgi:hypothetical protein
MGGYADRAPSRLSSFPSAAGTGSTVTLAFSRTAPANFAAGTIVVTTGYAALESGSADDHTLVQRALGDAAPPL